MTQSYVPSPSPAAAMVQLARLKAGLSQRELAERASVPATMVSAYERDLRQPTLETLRKQLEPYDPHDDVLEALERNRSPEERDELDRRVEAWRRATPVA